MHRSGPFVRQAIYRRVFGRIEGGVFKWWQGSRAAEKYCCRDCNGRSSRYRRCGRSGGADGEASLRRLSSFRSPQPAKFVICCLALRRLP